MLFLLYKSDYIFKQYSKSFKGNFWGRNKPQIFTHHIFFITIWAEVIWNNYSILKKHFVDSLGEKKGFLNGKFHHVKQK